MDSSLLPGKLCALVDLWVQKRDQRRYPSKANFDAITVWPWIGHIGIVERRKDAKELFVRLAGSMIVEYDGADFTGKYLADCVPEHALEDILYPYRISVDRHAPVFIRLPPGHLGGSFRHLDRLILPCSDDDRFIDHFIAAIYVSQFEKHRNERGVYGNPTLPADRRDAALHSVAAASSMPARTDPVFENSATRGPFVEVIDV